MINRDASVALGAARNEPAGDTAMSAIEIVIVGVVATTIMDLYQQVIRMVSGLARTNWALVGRWIALMPRGRFMHDTIADAPAVGGEDGIGWLFHYLIGIVFAGVYLIIVYGPMASEPNIVNGLVFGLVTLVFPWLVLQPALGFGVCAVKLPNRSTVRTQNFASHLVFGAALYIGAMVAPVLLKAQ